MLRRKPLPPEPREARPSTISAARLLIEKIFREQGKLGWDARDRQVYFLMTEVEGAETPKDVRKIVADLEKSRMLLFREEK